MAFTVKRGKKWYACIKLPDGSITRKAVGTKKQADVVARKWEQEFVEGKFGLDVKSKEVTLEKFSKQYLEYAELNKSRRSFLSNRSHINQHLIPAFGGMPLSSISFSQCEEYKRKRLNSGASPYTVIHEMSTLSHMMKIAARLGYQGSNAIRDVERPKIPEREPRFLSEDEVDSVLQAAIGLGKKGKRYAHLYPTIQVGLQTGMRKQELFNYKWTDTDFKNKTVKIESKDDWHTKNYRVRYIGMTEVLLEVLEQLKKYQKHNNYNSEYVLTYLGNRLTDKIDRSLKKLSEESGVPDLKLHLLRHTFASHLVMNGVDLRFVQELLGHRDYSTTLKYAHLAPGHVKDLVNALHYGKKKVDENIGK